MSVLLPERLDPWRAVVAQSAYAGTVPLTQLSRLVKVVLGSDGPAHYELQFTRDEQGRKLALGRVRMTLILRCQRCLEAFTLPVDARFALALVHAAGESDHLDLAAVPDMPEHLDALPLGDGPVRPLEWIEDELLLAIPQVPMHPSGHCTVGAKAADDVAPPARVSPFAVLADLRGAAPEPGEGVDKA